MNNAFRKLWVFSLFLLIGLEAIGQEPKLKQYGFAGEDRSVFAEKNTQVGVTLGEKDDGSIYCSYRWDVLQQPPTSTVDFELSNRFLARPTVWLEKPGNYIFQVSRASEYGIQREIVNIEISNTFRLLSAKPKNSCYHPGDDITIDDFILETDPPGFEDKIYLREDSKKVKNIDPNSYIPLDEQNIYFQMEDEDGVLVDCGYKGHIAIVEEYGAQFLYDMHVDDPVQMQNDYERLVKFLYDNGEELIEDIELYKPIYDFIAEIFDIVIADDDPVKMVDNLENARMGLTSVQYMIKAIKAFFLYKKYFKPPEGLKFQFGFFKDGFRPNLGIVCCEEKGRPVLCPFLDGGFLLRAGFAWDKGIPRLSFPGVGGMNMRLGVYLGVKGHWNYEPIDFRCSEHLLYLGAFAESEVAIGAYLRHPDLLSFTIGAYARVTGGFTIGTSAAQGVGTVYFPWSCIEGTPKSQLCAKKKDVTFSMYIQARSCFLGFRNQSAEYELINIPIAEY